jgi:hypothetical protein
VTGTHPAMFDYTVNTGRIEREGPITRLRIGPTPASRYSDAQLDSYSGAQPFLFQYSAPATLTLRARFSHHVGSLKGTAGFGFWNHPFGPGGGVIPRSLWFFYGSPESDLRFSRHTPGHGLKAALLDALPFWHHASPRYSAAAPLAAAQAHSSQPNSALFRLATKLSNSKSLISLGVRSAQRIFHAPECMLALDLTCWHTYQLQWRKQAVVWSVDGIKVFQAHKPPRGPLGLVIWIDNYAAQFNVNGKYGFTHLETSNDQWLEVEQVMVF